MTILRDSIGTCLCGYGHVWVEARSWHPASSSNTFHLIFEIRALFKWKFLSSARLAGQWVSGLYLSSIPNPSALGFLMCVTIPGFYILKWQTQFFKLVQQELYQLGHVHSTELNYQCTVNFKITRLNERSQVQKITYYMFIKGETTSQRGVAGAGHRFFEMRME